MKYRVKQVGNWYYPQYRLLIFWINIGSPKLSLDKAKHVIAQDKKLLQTPIIRVWEVE